VFRQQPVLVLPAVGASDVAVSMFIQNGRRLVVFKVPGLNRIIL
jgi:hypothetical protein